jgi:hypothetical protein
LDDAKEKLVCRGPGEVAGRGRCGADIDLVSAEEAWRWYRNEPGPAPSEGRSVRKCGAVEASERRGEMGERPLAASPAALVRSALEGMPGGRAYAGRNLTR